MSKLYRQGDVLLQEVKEIPKNAKVVKQERIVLAYGEVTGHCHQISTKEAKEKVTDTERFIEVLEKACLNHEEHSTIVLPKGKYKITQQKEYFPEAIRNVTD